MSFTLDQVVPWGRSFEEYVAMFALTPDDLSRRIVGCGDGPAAFNAVATSKGVSVVSVDPIYAFSTAQIRQRIDETYAVVMAETKRNQNEFVWRQIKSPDELGRLRRQAMSEFLADRDAGAVARRYVPGELPSLPFADRVFDLALCSHFLFLYSQHYDLEFHIKSVAELCRIAEEVRVFPLNELGAHPSRHLDKVLAHCRAAGMNPEIVPVDYEFQKGANQLLRLRTMQ